MITDGKTQIKLLVLLKRQWKALLLTLILSQFLSLELPKVNACTTFFLQDGNHMVCGRNFDYSLGEYLIFVNHRNVIKRAFSYYDEVVEMPATWTSKYGSITFNMNGHNSPTDGMNEMGLIITSLVLVESEYPVIAEKPSVSLDQWIQYMLDNCATVDEVINKCSQINIRYLPQDNVRLHFLVTDANGKNAVVEFLDGELVATTGEELEKKAIANSTYELSINYFNQGGDPDLPATASLNRFFNAVQMVDTYNGEDIIDYSYSIMEATAQRHTQRRLVYDISNMRVYLRSMENEQLRFFDFSDFDFSCQAEPLVYQETASDVGNIRNKFVPYTTEMNKILSEISWQFLEKTYTEEELDEFAEYPETFECFQVNAGFDSETCENHAVLNGNSPSYYTGKWTVVSGYATFDNSSEANTYARDLEHGENVLRWTLTGESGSHFDEVAITSNYVQVNAGNDVSICEDEFVLSGNQPQVGEIGEWSVLSGSGIIQNISDYNTVIYELSSGVNNFQWSISNNNCSASDIVVITNNSVHANAGKDSLIKVSSINLYATEVSDGTGEWILLEGTGTLNNPKEHNTLASDIGIGVNKFLWEVTNQNCSDKDTVEIIYDLKSSVRNVHNSSFEFIVYPNPTKQYLHLKNLTLTGNKVEVRIFNANGQLKYSNSLQNQNSESSKVIDVSSLRKGNYVIVLRTNNFENTLKFVKL